MGRTGELGLRMRRIVSRCSDRAQRLVASRLRFLPAVAASGFLLSIVLVVIAASMNDRYGAAVQDNFVATGHLREALGDLVDLEDELADATSSARAFLLSGDRDHLIPYAAAASASRTLLKRIEAEQGKVDTSAAGFIQQARNYLDALDTIVSKMEKGERNAALATAGPDLGQAAKSALHSEIHAQRTRMTESVLERRAAIVRQLSDGRRFNLLAAVTVALVLVVFGVLLRHYFHASQSTSRDLAALNATLEQAIRQRTAELTKLSQHLLTIREEERAALARDIHDQIGSELAALRMDCARLENAGTGHNPLAKSTWPRVRKALDDLTQAHRRIINSLHPTVLDHLGLEVAIRELLDERLTTEPLEHHVSVEGTMQDLPPEVAIAAYRVVQEALSNVLKHAKAKRVTIVLRRHASRLTINITDDGIGIGPGAAQQGRLGLVGIRERTRKLGGALRIGSGPARVGTRITAWFRVQAPTNDEASLIATVSQVQPPPEGSLG